MRLGERVRFVTGKYIEHCAWPSKFDGITFGEEELEGDRRFDDPDFYWEHWDDWGEAGRRWGDSTIHTPTSAEVAEAVLYQSMRLGILQKAFNEIAKKDGTKPIRVLTPEKFLRELKNEEKSKQ